MLTLTLGFSPYPLSLRSIIYTVGYPAQARGSGCMSITANLAHQPIKDLKLASDYYNKIFWCISGPPKWLQQNLQQAFKEIEVNRHTFYQHNPDWEIPETPVLTKQCCNHPLLSGSSTLCTCSCCHYGCPTHSAEYYGFSYWTCLFMTEIAFFTMFTAEIIASLITLIIITITRWERAHLEREIAQAEERNTHLREEVEWLREQHTIQVITKKPVILIVQNQSPKVKEEEVTPEIPKPSPSPDDYDPNNFPIREEDDKEDEDNWPRLFTDWHH